jgi:hypothetical protein
MRLLAVQNSEAQFKITVNFIWPEGNIQQIQIAVPRVATDQYLCRHWRLWAGMKMMKARRAVESQAKASRSRSRPQYSVLKRIDKYDSEEDTYGHNTILAVVFEDTMQSAERFYDTSWRRRLIEQRQDAVRLGTLVTEAEAGTNK